MDYFEEWAELLNKAGMELNKGNASDKELAKQLFLLSQLFKDCSKTDVSKSQPLENYLAVRYKEMENKL